MQEKHLNRIEGNINQDDIVKIDEKTKGILFDTLKNEDDSWKKIIVAGEMALLDINVADNLSWEDKDVMKQELERTRAELKKTEDKKEYIDLARCIYRFQNIGLDYPELTDEEKKILENLPRLFRQDPEWHGHLNYIPQIAKAIDKNVDDISAKNDYKLARKHIEEKLQEGGEEELKSMIFTGLLAELSKEEANQLLNSEHWNEKRWPEVLKIIQDTKDNEQGYLLARYLPPLKKLIKFKKEFYGPAAVSR